MRRSFSKEGQSNFWRAVVGCVADQKWRGQSGCTESLVILSPMPNPGWCKEAFYFLRSEKAQGCSLLRRVALSCRWDALGRRPNLCPFIPSL